MGLNLACGDVPTDSNDNENLKTQLNLEIAYRINKTNKSDMVIAIKDKWSLFGIIEGKHRGSHNSDKALIVKPYKNYSLINGRI